MDAWVVSSHVRNTIFDWGRCLDKGLNIADKEGIEPLSIYACSVVADTYTNPNIERN